MITGSARDGSHDAGGIADRGRSVRRGVEPIELLFVPSDGAHVLPRRADVDMAAARIDLREHTGASALEDVAFAGGADEEACAVRRGRVEHAVDPPLDAGGRRLVEARIVLHLAA